MNIDDLISDDASTQLLHDLADAVLEELDRAMHDKLSLLDAPTLRVCTSILVHRKLTEQCARAVRLAGLVQTTEEGRQVMTFLAAGYYDDDLALEYLAKLTGDKAAPPTLRAMGAAVVHAKAMRQAGNDHK